MAVHLEPSLPKHLDERLKAIHPSLSFKWNPSGHWEVWERTPDGRDCLAYSVAHTVDGKKKFRPIDNRTFDALRKGDNAQYRNSYEKYVGMRNRRDFHLVQESIERKDRIDYFSKNIAGAVRGLHHFAMGAR